MELSGHRRKRGCDADAGFAAALPEVGDDPDQRAPLAARGRECVQ